MQGLAKKDRKKKNNEENYQKKKKPTAANLGFFSAHVLIKFYSSYFPKDVLSELRAGPNLFLFILIRPHAALANV